MTRKLVVLQRIQIGFHRGVVDAQELVGGGHHVDTVWHMSIDTSNKTVREIADEILKL